MAPTSGGSRKQNVTFDAMADYSEEHCRLTDTIVNNCSTLLLWLCQVASLRFNIQRELRRLWIDFPDMVEFLYHSSRTYSDRNQKASHRMRLHRIHGNKRSSQCGFLEERRGWCQYESLFQTVKQMTVTHTHADHTLGGCRPLSQQPHRHSRHQQFNCPDLCRFPTRSHPSASESQKVRGRDLRGSIPSNSGGKLENGINVVLSIPCSVVTVEGCKVQRHQVEPQVQ